MTSYQKLRHCRRIIHCQMVCHSKIFFKNLECGTSLVAQWMGVHLPVQGTQVWSLVWEDPTCWGATKPTHHNYRACTLESGSQSYWACVLQLLTHTQQSCTPQPLSPRAATTEAGVPRASAPQQEKPPQWEARALQWRVAPTRCN